ncbi:MULTISPECIES: hypothetical protein [Flavobacteriaceae]|uniref:Uncharacterized protein n=2 Tax=Flavobacteriaceae TaxID=49546 RepID=A0ABS3ESE0_9FLAO|nr:MULTISPECIES: hypothetical protein [Allomuricauda]MBO0329165.1 hypothetical protein [[Muricauda] lutisoli]MBO0343553.1 hypothetical protein [Allomuricauda profundi]MEC7771643.1 hypothetical protein [Bacteroidota bacterium]
MFIAYTFFTDLLGYFIKFNDSFQFFSEGKYASLNIIIYNIYQLIAYAFFYWVYFKTLKRTQHKKLVKYGAFLVLVSYLTSLIFQNPLYRGLYYAELVGSWVLLGCIIFYFKEKKNENSSYHQGKNLLFWVSSGSFIFYAITPYIFLLGSIDDHVWYDYHFQKILFVLIAIMYGFYMLGLLLGERKAFR